MGVAGSWHECRKITADQSKRGPEHCALASIPWRHIESSLNPGLSEMFGMF
jgi:hypothetical protein